MKSKKSIVFLGMMGSGKTSIGKIFSKKLQIDFFDIDKMIENQVGMKIYKIFEKKGEEYFREIEEKLTLKVLDKKKKVISLGGGAFLNKNIREEIITNHISFWLKWDSEILIKRIINTPKRPLAFEVSKNQLMDLIKKRSNIYSKAMYKVKCDDLSKIEIVDKIVKLYDSN